MLTNNYLLMTKGQRLASPSACHYVKKDTCMNSVGLLVTIHIRYGVKPGRNLIIVIRIGHMCKMVKPIECLSLCCLSEPQGIIMKNDFHSGDKQEQVSQPRPQGLFS